MVHMSENNRYFMNKNELLANAEKAFEEKQFCVYYQPQYNYMSGRIVGAEALVRWIHPEYGMQSPGDFIPVFEENGLITRLDLYVFEEICSFISRCRGTKIKTVPISFNVSRYDVINGDFIERIEEIRKKYDIPVTNLRAEITESSMIGGNDHMVKIVHEFQSLGYVVEMDDFGSGYSSLNVLKDIEVDIIKLDMAFMRGNLTKRGGIIISSIIRMANWLGTPVIAEGVETPEQAEYLKSIGCIYIQGFLFSKPVPENEYVNMLRNLKSDVLAPGMKLIDKLDAEKFWSPESFETLVFNNFVGGAAVISFKDDEIETLRVNERYLKELGMIMNQQDIILNQKNLNFAEKNKQIYIDTINRAIVSNDYETCETWREVFSQCCGEDSLYIESTMRVIGRAEGQYLLYVLIRNITQEKKMYMKLYDSEKKFRTAGEQANIYCWEYTIDTKEMRPCFRCMRDLGLPPLLENYPEPVIESGLFPPDYADMYRDWHKQLAEGAEHLEAIIPLTVNRIPFHVRYTAEFDENGHPYKAYGSATQVVDMPTEK